MNIVHFISFVFSCTRKTNCGGITSALSKGLKFIDILFNFYFLLYSAELWPAVTDGKEELRIIQ